MKRLEKFFIGTLFSLLFSLFILLTTFYFQLFNASYLFNTFKEHGLYEKIPKALASSLPNDLNLSREERLAYGTIAANISPDFVEQIVETNLTEALDFIHGRSNDIIISFPTKELGLGETNIKWSLSENSTPQLKEQLNLIHGIGTKILILWIIVFILLMSLFLLYGKVSNKIITGGSRLLITSGTMLLLSSLISRFLLIQMAQNLSNGSEPSQKLLGLLASSLLIDIAFSWSVISIFVLVLGVTLFIIEAKLIKSSKII